MSKNELVSIIVLTHNSKHYLQNCIKSIEEQDYQNFELIIVDNDSSDGTKQMLAEIKIQKPLNMKIILNSRNLGYNLGNFEGIKNSKGEYIAIINPDIVLNKSWLSEIINEMRNDPLIISVNGKLLNSNGEIQSTGGLLDIYCATTERKHTNTKLQKIFYNSGAAFVFKKNLLSKIQLDPNLFLYYDDVDFAWQVRLLGLKIGYCDKAEAIHSEGHSIPGLPPFKFYHIIKNRMYLCLKHYSMNRLIRRFFTVIFLAFCDSIYYSITKKSLNYFLVFFKALFWNMSNIHKMKRERRKIQKYRLVSDSEIEEFMEKRSIELKIFFNKA